MLPKLRKVYLTQQSMKQKPSNHTAFTLIELLVVISIIAILAGIALPVFGEVKIRGDQTKALSNAKQIGTACKIYAQDFNGSYPQYTDIAAKTEAKTGAYANDVLSTLIPDYLPEKSIFAIGKSKYCTKAGSADATTAANINKLGPAESEWAYVVGLTDTSYSRWPLLASGFKPGTTPPVYDTDDTKPGGIWKGKKAIVIRCDGSGNVESLKKSDKSVKRNPDEPDATAKNAFADGASDTPAWFTFSDSLFVAHATESK